MHEWCIDGCIIVLSSNRTFRSPLPLICFVINTLGSGLEAKTAVFFKMVRCNAIIQSIMSSTLKETVYEGLILIKWCATETRGLPRVPGRTSEITDIQQRRIGRQHSLIEIL